MSIDIGNVRYRENINNNDIENILDNFEDIISQFPIERQNVILKDPNCDYLNSLKKLKKRCGDKNYIYTSYVFSKNISKGRLFANDASLQCLPREIRNTLCSQNMVDFDFENCHFAILNYCCK